MEEVTLTEPETRFYSELFLCCDVEKTGKVPMLKAMELFRSADIANEAVIEITALAGIPSAALHISRTQFYSCLKLIAAHQAAMPLRQELIAATVLLPLPHFSWKETPTTTTCENGLSALPPPPPTDRRNSLQRRADAVRRNSQQQEQQLQDASDVPSTDSEVERNESSCGGEFDEAAGVGIAGGVTSTSSRETRRRGKGGSPEAWSTNSDSPTPTNSVAERPWAQDTLWHGLLGDEHRQLLGTEEESSDRHSSDEDDNENELITLYQITPEQREYYNKQFKTVQRDPNGLLSGQAARVFFEKSRIPVEELRHIWQLCDVTRDGALSLSEFTAAMHLVVLRRNNIPLPTSLPHCLHPNMLKSTQTAPQNIPQEPPEADLLHLNDDDDDEHTDNTIIAANISGGSTSAKTRPLPMSNDKNIMNLSSISTSSQASNSSRRDVTPPAALPPPPVKNRSISNSPNADKVVATGVATTSPTMSVSTSTTSKDKAWGTNAAASTNALVAGNAVDGTTASSQWTKFSESPTTTSAAPATTAAVTAAVPAVSSPGLKPVLFDMKRTAQDVGSNPQILHPVPLRVTPIGTAIAAAADSTNTQATNDTESIVVLRETSPKAVGNVPTAANNQAAIQSLNSSTHRDSMQSGDLRAIQRPQAKKLPAKNIGALPPPPQREPSIGSNSLNDVPEPVAAKKEPPPLPPPRPHRHTRSSSLDLNKFKVGAVGAQQAEITAQASFDMQTSTGFADFTHFADESGAAASTAAVNVHDAGNTGEQQQHSLPPAQPPPTAAGATVVPPTRISLQTQQRVSAFEVYRKPNTPRNSQSPPPLPPPPPTSSSSQQPTQPPPPAPFVQASQLPNADSFEKRVTAISDSLRHVSFKQNQTTTTELLHRLREQNNSLLHLCNDLSDELLSVQTRKEEIRLKLETAVSVSAVGAAPIDAAVPARTGSSISAPVTANITGGSSGSSGAYANI